MATLSIIPTLLARGHPHIFLFFILPFFNPCHLKSSFHFLLPLVLFSFTQEVSRAALPLLLPLISQFSLPHTWISVCSISPTERNCGSRFALHNKNWSSLSGSAFLFYFVSSQMIHLSPTCSWSYTHTAATTWAYGNWVSTVCVCGAAALSRSCVSAYSHLGCEQLG